MNKLALLFAAALAVCTQSALSQESQLEWDPISAPALHPPRELQPEAPVIGGIGPAFVRDIIMAQSFAAVFSRDYHVAFVPDAQSSEPEFALGFSEKNIITEWFEQPLRHALPPEDAARWEKMDIDTMSSGWETADSVKRLSKLSYELKVARCTVDIEPKLGGRLAAVWQKMLWRTAYSYVGGTTARPTEYHFFGRSGDEWWLKDRFLAGVAGPDMGRRPTLLMESVVTMRNYCRSPDPKLMTKLLNQVRSLETRLKALVHTP